MEKASSSLGSTKLLLDDLFGHPWITGAHLFDRLTPPHWVWVKNRVPPNLWLLFGVDEHPFATYFDVPRVQGFDPQPFGCGSKPMVPF